MSRLNDIANRLDKHMNEILKIILVKCDTLENENRIYRQEILRLEKIQRKLIQIVSEKMLKPKKALTSQEQENSK